MQKKHGWQNIINISGNTEKDFEKVVEFLEKNEIFNGQQDVMKIYGREVIQLRRIDYKIRVGKNEIQATFIENTETNEIFLKNAWIVK